MESRSLDLERRFIETYFNEYSGRNPIIKNYFDDNFSGIDGISNNIYDKNQWLEAVDNDFKQIAEPFSIRITDFKLQCLSENLKMIVTVSLWDIKLFKDFPEFDRIRSVFILEKNNGNFKIKHLSNSVSLLTLDRDEVYPITLTKFLKSWKKSLFRLGDNDQIDGLKFKNS